MAGHERSMAAGNFKDFCFARYISAFVTYYNYYLQCFLSKEIFENCDISQDVKMFYLLCRMAPPNLATLNFTH